MLGRGTAIEGRIMKWLSGTSNRVRFKLLRKGDPQLLSDVSVIQLSRLSRHRGGAAAANGLSKRVVPLTRSAA